MTERGYTIENSGENNGLIVGDNTGTINLSIQRAIRIPSLISTVVKSLGEICSSDEYSECVERFQDYRTDEKIEYNGVVKYKNIIQEFSVYYSTCDKHLNIYDDSNIQGKAKILKCVRLWYLQAKGEILADNKGFSLSDIEIIRNNSDRIIDMVKDKIYKAVMGTKGIETTYIEDVELGIECFTCYCFMECKILEKPI